MLTAAPPPSDIAHTIQLAVAPVFLLAGIAGILNLLAGRLARIVDRSRRIEEMFTPKDDPRHDLQVQELRLIDRRITIVNWSIFLCTASALLVCLVVAGLFVTSLASLGFGRTMAVTFVVAMLLLISGLLLFLVEVRVAVRAIRIRDELLERRG
jgi:hypothetical protein